MNKPFSLFNKNILITGASSGIGRECSILASQSGANLILVARNKERLTNTMSNLKKGNHICFPLDVTNYQDIETTVETAVKQIGKISGFIHSAGIEMTVPFRNMQYKTYENIFAVNVISAFEFARIITKKKYCSEKSASLVFISSIMGILGQPGKVAYCSTKSSLIGGVKAMALELAKRKIRVNCVLPGIVETELTRRMFETMPEEAIEDTIKNHPLGLGKPRDIANICLFLLSDLSEWITGSEFIVDGGYSAR